MFAPSVIVIVLVFAASALATRLHVNSGCILLDGEPLCAKRHRDVVKSAKIEAGFPGNSDRRTDTVGCMKMFKWPATYGDVYFGADNCLYDSKGVNFNGQCCRHKGGYMAKNPYRKA